LFPEKGKNNSIHDSLVVAGTRREESEEGDKGVWGVKDTPISLNAVDLLVMVSNVHGICCATANRVD